MKETIYKYIKLWKENFTFRTFIAALSSFVAGIGFILFNGALGIIYNSKWYGTICVYYILLTFLRGTIAFFQRKDVYRNEEESEMLMRKVSKYTHIVMLVLNLSLIVPIAIMVKGERGYEFGLIPAIAMAAYTTFRLTTSIINLRKSKKGYNCLVRELRAINLVDTLVAVLSMQNAMLIANGENMSAGVNFLSAYSSAGIFALIVFITIHSMVTNRE
ncbi:MAG: hypothetical protein K6B75_00320 [Lachnospiraceae bacterium]|nr:hypothetical protein [Lachnospiraceae bacterium]